MNGIKQAEQAVGKDEILMLVNRHGASGAAKELSARGWEVTTWQILYWLKQNGYKRVSVYQLDGVTL